MIINYFNLCKQKHISYFQIKENLKKFKKMFNYKLHGLFPYIQKQDSKIMTNKSNHENVASKFIQKSNNHV
jgi:hypothetical protein